MKHRLNLDIKDPKYTLLKEIFKIMDSIKSSEILAPYVFKNDKQTKNIFKTSNLKIELFILQRIFTLDLKPQLS